MILILIPILAMLGLGFIVPGKTSPRMKPFLGTLFFVFSLLLGIRCFVSAEWFYPEADAITHVRGQIDHVLHTAGWQKKPLMILEGSSVTEFGINQELLQKKLQEQGIDVTIVKLALPGANHFERLFMMQMFLTKLASLSHHHEIEAIPVILMSEVFETYDQNPLNLFLKESHTQRSLVWLEPHYAMVAWKALCSSLQSKEHLSAMILEHLCLNRFAVGIFSTLELLNYNKKVLGFSSLQKTKETFCYQKTKEDVEKTILSPPSTAEKMIVPPPGWMIYYQELFAQMGSVVHALIFYGLPTLEMEQYNYQKAFAQALPPHTLMLGPASTQFIKKLLNEKNWFDSVHPQGPGAYLFTTWLCNQIAINWSEIMAMHWQYSP